MTIYLGTNSTMPCRGYLRQQGPIREDSIYGGRRNKDNICAT